MWKERTITPLAVEVTPTTPPSPATARHVGWLDGCVARLRNRLRPLRRIMMVGWLGGEPAFRGYGAAAFARAKAEMA